MPRDCIWKALLRVYKRNLNPWVLEIFFILPLPLIQLFYSKKDALRFAKNHGFWQPHFQRAWKLMHPLHPFQHGRCCWKCRKNGLWMELSRGKAASAYSVRNRLYIQFCCCGFWENLTEKLKPNYVEKAADFSERYFYVLQKGRIRKTKQVFKQNLLLMRLSIIHKNMQEEIYLNIIFTMR